MTNKHITRTLTAAALAALLLHGSYSLMQVTAPWWWWLGSLAAGGLFALFWDLTERV